MLPSITASVSALSSAPINVLRGARRRSHGTPSRPPSTIPAGPSDGETVVDAAVGVIYGRTAFATGVALLEVGRDTDKALLDVLA